MVGAWGAQEAADTTDFSGRRQKPWQASLRVSRVEVGGKHGSCCLNPVSQHCFSAPDSRECLVYLALTDNPWEVLNLNVNDEVTCKVVNVIEQGVKLVVEGASAFLPTNNFGEKTEFAEGEEFTAKVRVFDAPKHKLIVTLKVEAPKVKAPKKQNNDNELKYMSQDKVSNTFGDFINLDDYK